VGVFQDEWAGDRYVEDEAFASVKAGKGQDGRVSGTVVFANKQLASRIGKYEFRYAFLTLLFPPPFLFPPPYLSASSLPLLSFLVSSSRRREKPNVQH
jgi:hypothetical protein